MHNVEIDVEALSMRTTGHLSIEIAGLLVMVRVTARKLEEWGRVEQRFIKCILFHVNNEELEVEMVGRIV